MFEDSRLQFLHKYLICVVFMILFTEANEIEVAWRVELMLNVYECT